MNKPDLDFCRPPLLGQGLDEAPVDATGDAAEPTDGEHGEDDAREKEVEAGHGRASSSVREALLAAESADRRSVGLGGPQIACDGPPQAPREPCSCRIPLFGTPSATYPHKIRKQLEECNLDGSGSPLSTE